MSARAVAVCLAFAVAAPAFAVFAQDPIGSTAVLTIDPDRLFADTRFGKQAQALLEAAEQDLLAENRKLETALEAEEKNLTELRSTLPAEEFRKLADAFNTKAEEIRAASLAKARSLAAFRNEDRRNFLDAVGPVLAGLTKDMGASAILDKKTVFFSLERIDVTDLAIARIDTLLDDALLPKATPVPAGTTEPAP